MYQLKYPKILKKPETRGNSQGPKYQHLKEFVEKKSEIIEDEILISGNSKAKTTSSYIDMEMMLEPPISDMSSDEDQNSIIKNESDPSNKGGRSVDPAHSYESGPQDQYERIEPVQVLTQSDHKKLFL
ncbi:hypothetical protein AYI68_g5907 [Smittium mucronatum]|uniref:Uncharacterized protein n=1 Tax=Smittium mucronatum TaxID=133383 RepID=A0A1R0GSY6_9FUNG|nr:hypothetical protein AYI68_g5907 [Smittium mucronatum]